MKGGSCESAAALRATRRRDLRRLRGRMMYATVPAKSAKSTTTTTDTASGVIFWGPADASMISSAFAPQAESVGVSAFWQDALAMTQKRPAGVSGARRKSLCAPVRWMGIRSDLDDRTGRSIFPSDFVRSQMNRNYTLMNALSAWAVALCCPHCGRTGSCTVSEDADDGGKEPRLRVEGLSSGFVVVELRPGAGQDIRCGTCNSSALK
jgi:hypothetical protein